MKRGIIGSLIGIAIVIAADLILRVILALTLEAELSFFSYANYPGFFWGFIISIFALVSSFLGGAFTVNYADSKKLLSLITFGILLMILRYGQIHVVMERELMLPILTLIFSLIAVALVWKFFIRKKQMSTGKDEVHPNKNKNKHHYPTPGT